MKQELRFSVVAVINSEVIKLKGQTIQDIKRLMEKAQIDQNGKKLINVTPESANCLIGKRISLASMNNFNCDLMIVR